MNSYERLKNRMEGNKVDYIPNLNIVMQFAAREIGVPFGKFATDYKLLSKGMYACYEKYGIDCLTVMSDPVRETEGFGAKIIIPEDGIPHCAEPLIKDISDIKKIKAIHPCDGKRMNDRLEAVRLLKDMSNGEVMVIGWVEGAYAECGDLMNVTNLMINLYDSPKEIHELLEITLTQAELFAIEQIKAGADIIGIGDSAASLISPSLYKEFILPYQKRLIDTIHNYDTKTKLHVCGDITPYFDLIAQTGADIVDCDHMVDMKEAIEHFPKSTCVSGNFDPVSVLLSGSADYVRQAVKQASELGVNNNMIAAGCEVPKLTPVENMKAVMQELRK